MKKILILTIICAFSILIGCSAGSDSTPKSAANTNSATGTKPAPQPSTAENKKAEPDKMEDGKSDADRSNSNNK